MLVATMSSQSSSSTLCAGSSPSASPAFATATLMLAKGGRQPGHEAFDRLAVAYVDHGRVTALAEFALQCIETFRAAPCADDAASRFGEAPGERRTQPGGRTGD